MSARPVPYVLVHVREPVESALDVMDSRVETRAELLFEFDEMRIEVGPGRDGVRLQSHELPAGVLVWGALYWGACRTTGGIVSSRSPVPIRRWHLT